LKSYRPSITKPAVTVINSSYKSLQGLNQNSSNIKQEEIQKCTERLYIETFAQTPYYYSPDTQALKNNR
jgi:hypothetical protein